MCDNVLCSNCLVSRSLTEVESVSLTRFVTESPVLLLSCIDGCLGHHQPTRLLLTSHWRNNINNTSHRHHRTVCQSCLSPPLPPPLPVLKWVKILTVRLSLDLEPVVSCHCLSIRYRKYLLEGGRREESQPGKLVNLVVDISIKKFPPRRS